MTSNFNFLSVLPHLDHSRRKIMQVLLTVGLMIMGYLLGSIPFGVIIVKLLTGKDVRSVESGRTGGTNAMRAAGFGAGLLTAIMDVLKGAAALWIALAVGGNAWAHMLAPVGAILGHNYSLFLVERDQETGWLRFRGGAGGAPTVGGALAMWPVSILIVVPIGALVFFGLGYASLTTISVGLSVTILFAVRAFLGLSPWAYAIYGLIAEALLIWALRPNIRKLAGGTERVVSISLHGWLRSKRRVETSDGDSVFRQLD
jgi:glycerol-3-phosphate acyltransferase PlsY